ncbi:MAG: hypothetical protein GY819_13130 [Planctomycetaceae bacterium]|nr:hypothetical protein [Planctomycetaceae bacterium]
MKGDFSEWEFDSHSNEIGVLHQQGRGLLDQDWNAATVIAAQQRQIQGRDAIGPSVAAIPTEAEDSFKVQSAQADANGVEIELEPGRVWIDGSVIQVREGPTLTQPATYLGQPFHDDSVETSSIRQGIRDAVILEVWPESLNAFQNPMKMLEPALGGVDTTERAKLYHRLKLLRLEAGDDCSNLAQKLEDDLSTRGKLTVTADEITVAGDCPVDTGGGYSGFEHYLMRVEIAEPDAKGARFKWSRFNGGLVGRGAKLPAEDKVMISANDQMINHCGQTRFYLEALQENAATGIWEIAFSANASLTADGELDLTNKSGSWPGGDGNEAFIRLWDGIDHITSANQYDLESDLGLKLQFDDPSTPNTLYKSGDFWTFPLRAAGAVDFDAAQAWPDNSAPQGIHYARVPLAILNWDSAIKSTISAPSQIDDCRKKFAPLTEISSGCCIAIKPGCDIHHALKKIFEAGGGCLCLLPGDHYLSRPLDLSGRSSIHIKGFGQVSRLHVADALKNASPFILKRNRDIKFESFAVLSENGAPVWACENVRRLTISDMFVNATFRAQSYPVIVVSGQCLEWTIENNTISGPAGIAGHLLSGSTINGNLWQGTVRGIDLKFLQRSQVEGNRFIGIDAARAEKFETEFADLKTNRLFASRPLSSLLEPTLARPSLADISPFYIGLDVSVGFDVDVIDNYFAGSIGISSELVENCKIHENDFMTTVTAASCGLVHSLRFSENRIGQGSGEFKDQKGISCKTGLLILADAVDCQVVDNTFANVQQGIVYESDIRGGKAVIRDFSANLFRLGKVTNDSASKLLLKSELRVKTRLDKQVLLNSSFFSIGKCQQVLIQGNRFNATQSGIEWSGTKNIVDFRIASNSFTGCQDVAIQIEPDDRIFYMADPVDTKVRLIEKNRFDVYSGAVRATIGAVRVEKNDIRVKAPRKALVPPLNIMVAAATNVYRAQPYIKAAKANDVPMMRMMSAALVDAAEKNPDSINRTGFSKAINDTVLKKYKPQTGDVWADKAFIMKTFANITANNYLVADINTGIASVKLNLEGYAVNLSGVQNRAVHNRIFGSNTQRPGGIMFHVVSGEVRDNEVAVPSMALLLNGKLGLAGAYKGAEIIGNSLTASGIPGKKATIYALAIPSLSAGNLSIANNQFKGTVMVGGDPIAAQGFAQKDKFKLANEVVFYNVIKYDMSMYATTAIAKAFPVTLGNFGIFTPPSIVSPAWLSDPHGARPVVQFSNNRLIQGWLGIFQALTGAYWPVALLKKQASKALVVNLTGNVLDYGGSVVGSSVIIVGNQSQLALKYRANQGETVGNLPAAQSF